MKLPPGDLNSSPCPPHPTSSYTYGVTTAPRVRGDNKLFFSNNLFFKIICAFPFR